MIILASQSPRRREILTQAGYRFEVRVSGLHEEREPGEGPDRYVQRLARDKARAVAAGAEEWVLAADTTVVVDGEVLEKPADAGDAARMLRLLSGRAHEVLTGVCLRRGGMEMVAVERTRVEFVALSEQSIEDYVASGEPFDKAGGYAIQGLASKFVRRIEGCFFNVVGLPVSRVGLLLAEAGYEG
jgi:septum formation protein